MGHMRLGPFFTELDSRQEVKGSRDPLGIQQIWTRFGRRVVGNLTTVSNSLRDFTTLLIGLYLAERVAEQQGTGTELATFLRWEQLAGYARGLRNNDWVFRGTEQAQVKAQKRPLVLSRGSEGQILSDQKTYGLWGLYTMPARQSGLVQRNGPRLEAAAARFVEQAYLPFLRRPGLSLDRLVQVASHDGTRVYPDGRDKALLDAIGAMLLLPLRQEERDVYRTHLLHGGPDDPTHGVQAVLAALVHDELIQGQPAGSAVQWEPALIRRLAARAEGAGETGKLLARRLQDIVICESVLAPISLLFSYLLGCNGRPLGDARAAIRKGWGTGVRTIDPDAFGSLREYLSAQQDQTAERWIAIAAAAAAGRYDELVGLLIETNREVMAARGGAAWIGLEGGDLRVLYQEERGRIADAEELPRLWQFPYFLDSVRTVGAVVEASA